MTADQSLNWCVSRLRGFGPRMLFCMLACVFCRATLASESLSEKPALEKKVFPATDSLLLNPELNQDAADCLAGLRWMPAGFDVAIEKAIPGQGDFLIRFPSAVSTGDVLNDRVAVEWYFAKEGRNFRQKARSVVVVHESGRNMKVGRMIARGLSALGLHAFMVQLPGYGVRRTERAGNIEQMIPALRQGIADVRRTRDAVAALPFLDVSVIALQGTSLGGFVAATVAGIDHGYDRTVILLAGGNLQEVILHGAKDAAGVRQKLRSAGVTDEQIREYSQVIEPLRLAHRVRPESTWLFSGLYDDVVPPRCSEAFASAAGLRPDHHVEMPADHYTGVVFLPMVLQEIHRFVNTDLGKLNGRVEDHSEFQVSPGIGSP